MLPEQVKSAIEGLMDDTLTSVKSVGGGSINSAAKITTSTDAYFVKWNNATTFPGMFDAEMKGLDILREASGFVVPKVIAGGTAENVSFIVMEFLDHDQPSWHDAGKTLADMHKFADEKNNIFGLDHDNYIGSLHQSNKVHDNWPAFFANERILPQMKLAVDQQRLSKNDLVTAENFCKCIGEIFPDEKPSLLHGDLWSGNFMFTKNGAAIFDPAVHWGHREMDIAMTKLFGGYDEEFYEGYIENYPLEKNWEKRIDYCNLYPLLVHVNLFGGGYVNDVRRTLNHFK